MGQTGEFVAVLSCSPFTGATVYINLVEHRQADWERVSSPPTRANSLTRPS